MPSTKLACRRPVLAGPSPSVEATGDAPSNDARGGGPARTIVVLSTNNLLAAERVSGRNDARGIFRTGHDGGGRRVCCVFTKRSGRTTVVYLGAVGILDALSSIFPGPQVQRTASAFAGVTRSQQLCALCAAVLRARADDGAPLPRGELGGDESDGQIADVRGTYSGDARVTLSLMGGCTRVGNAACFWMLVDSTRRARAQTGFALGVSSVGCFGACLRSGAHGRGWRGRARRGNDAGEEGRVWFAHSPRWRHAYSRRRGRGNNQKLGGRQAKAGVIGNFASGSRRRRLGGYLQSTPH